MASNALLSDPIFYGDDSAERQEYAQMQRINSRPPKEKRPMFIGPDGKLHHKHDANVNDPH